MTTTLESKPSLRNIPRNLVLYLLGTVVFGLTIDGGIYAVLLNLYLLRLGYGAEFIGTLNSAGLLLFALISLPIGSIKRFTSRQMLLAGMLFSAIGMIGLPLAQYAPGDLTGPLLIAARMIGMIGLSTFFVHGVPFVMQITPPSCHNRALSWSMAAIAVAGFIGGTLGGLLPGYFSNLLGVSLDSPRPYQLPLIFSAMLLIPAFFAIKLVRDGDNVTESEEIAEEPSSEGHAKLAGVSAIAGLIVIVILVRTLQSGGVGVINTFSNVYFDDALGVPTSRIGFLSGMGKLVGVPVALSMPWLIARFSSFKLVIASLLAIVVLMIPMALAPDWRIAGIAFVLITSMSSMRFLSFLTFSLELVSAENRGLMAGAGEMAIGAGFGLSSFIGGYLIVWYRWSAVFTIGAITTIAGTILFWLAFRNRQPKASQPQ